MIGNPDGPDLERYMRRRFDGADLSRVRLGELVDASAAVAATPARNGEDRRARRRCCARAGPDEVAAVVSWLSGELTQRQIGVGWALLRERPAPRRGRR